MVNINKYIYYKNIYIFVDRFINLAAFKKIIKLKIFYRYTFVVLYIPNILLSLLI